MDDPSLRSRAIDPVDILAVSNYGPSSPAFRVRIGNLASALARKGVRIERLSTLTDAETDRFHNASTWAKGRAILRGQRRLHESLDARGLPDTVLIQQRVDFSPGLATERRLARAQRLVWDVDDALWMRSTLRISRRAWLTGDARIARWTARHAAHVIAGNHLLAEDIAAWTDAPVSVIPSLVDTDAVSMRRHDDGAELVVGWIGSPGTAGYIDRVLPAISALARALPQSVRFLVVGAGRSYATPGVRIDSVRWSPDAERAALGAIDIGVMPMPDDTFARGKCAYKALQYMAAGVPVVADPVGVTRSVVAPLSTGPAGYVPDAGSEWVDALVDLARDPDLRSAFGRAGRERIVQDFSIVRWAPTVAAVLRGVPAPRNPDEGPPDPQPASAAPPGRISDARPKDA